MKYFNLILFFGLVFGVYNADAAITIADNGACPDGWSDVQTMTASFYKTCPDDYTAVRTIDVDYYAAVGLNQDNSGTFVVEQCSIL